MLSSAGIDIDHRCVVRPTENAGKLSNRRTCMSTCRLRRATTLCEREIRRGEATDMRASMRCKVVAPQGRSGPHSSAWHLWARDRGRADCRNQIAQSSAPPESSVKCLSIRPWRTGALFLLGRRNGKRTYYARKRVVEGVAECEADLEPLDVREVAGDAAEHGWGHARAGEVE
jgi:hypothetical protein